MEQLGTVYLLDEDPSLLRHVPDRYHAAARRAAAAPAYRLAAGTWQPDILTTNPDDPPFGLLLLDGLLLRDVVVAHTTCGELVGAQDLLRPWDDFGTRAPMPLEIEWKVLRTARIAVLDQEFAHVLAAWPALMNDFIQRAIERAHSLALHVAIHCIRRVDISLLVLFCHLSDRFGTVTPSGIALDLDLTQHDLGKLVGATRQSVSEALGQLNRRELLRRRTDKSWLLSRHAAVRNRQPAPPAPETATRAVVTHINAHTPRDRSRDQFTRPIRRRTDRPPRGTRKPLRVRRPRARHHDLDFAG